MKKQILLAFVAYLVFSVEGNTQTKDIQLPYTQEQLCRLKTNADKGDIEANLSMGIYFFSGIFDNSKDVINIDKENALPYFLKAADKGNFDAMLHLSSIYFLKLISDNINSSENKKTLANEALKWGYKAKLSGDGRADYVLSLIFTYGPDEFKDIDKAENHCTNAIKMGYYQAYMCLIAIYTDPNFGKLNYQKAVILLKKASGLKVSDAQYLLGRIYLGETFNHLRLPIENDAVKGLTLLRDAGESGNKRAINWLKVHDNEKKEYWVNKSDVSTYNWLAYPPFETEEDRRLNLYNKCQ